MFAPLLFWVLLFSPIAALGGSVSPPASARAAPSRNLELGKLQDMLQHFVDKVYLRGFRHLGDERDFDHGHLLLDARSLEPVAVLYHTQELADYHFGGDCGYVDAGARNWIQWIGRGGLIENARRYARARYPRSASWDLFRSVRLPVLRAHHTVTAAMLDPRLLGVDVRESLQWVFTRTECSDQDEKMIRVVLPDKAQICLRTGFS